MRYSGRDFTQQEITLIQNLIAENPTYTRAELSRRVCKLLHWYKIDGGVKAMSCRVAMLRMQDNGLIQLPAPTRKRPETRIRFTAATDPEQPVTAAVHELPSLHFHRVNKGKQSSLWNEYIHRYHYLGYKALPGAQMRYFVTSGDQVIALLGFAASAWQCAPRDNYIGWSHDQRKKNLHLIINNARFLILPWIQSKNLASKILAKASRKIPDDWQHRYGYRPVLMETFVEKERFTGTCYKAANWLYMGKTKGRGKLGPAGKQSVPIKDLWLYPLTQRFRHTLVVDL
ncbi:MAG: DUF4338 domain-containing protein [Methylococcales bacterium]|nr:DUF4338 domain-containing protein [Methylococcales bacterium]